MRYSTAILAIAGLAAAQSSTSSAATSTTTAESGCGSAIDAIISNCLSLKQPLVGECGGNDWDCLCSAYTQIDTCYDNCVSDPRKAPADQQKTQYCAAADSYGSSASKSASSTATGSGSSSASATHSSVTGAASSESSTTTSVSDSEATGSSSGTGTGRGSQASNTDNGAPLATPVIGLAAVFGIAALL